ncbi:MAG TPA: hypothetical protein VMB78_07010 [Dissulfurispiraceae bacterium]|nr:hypothetical protein [Dissulfurispiraceae bacterium]
MEIKASGPSELVISGEILTLEDYMQIRKAIVGLGTLESLTLVILDSSFLGSAMLGFLLVLVREKNVALSILVKNEKLLRHLTVLQLLSVFQVKQL